MYDILNNILVNNITKIKINDICDYFVTQNLLYFNPFYEKVHFDIKIMQLFWSQA